MYQFEQITINGPIPSRIAGQAYLQEYRNTGTLKNAPATSDFKQYMTTTLLRRGFLFKNSLAVEQLMQASVEELFSTKFREIFLYAVDRDVEGLYTTIGDVKKNGPVGVFDAFANLFTASAAKFLPIFNISPDYTIAGDETVRVNVTPEEKREILNARTTTDGMKNVYTRLSLYDKAVGPVLGVQYYTNPKNPDTEKFTKVLNLKDNLPDPNTTYYVIDPATVEFVVTDNFEYVESFAELTEEQFDAGVKPETTYYTKVKKPSTEGYFAASNKYDPDTTYYLYDEKTKTYSVTDIREDKYEYTPVDKNKVEFSEDVQYYVKDENGLFYKVRTYDEEIGQKEEELDVRLVPTYKTATEEYDENVKYYVSNGNGTFKEASMDDFNTKAIMYVDFDKGPVHPEEGVTYYKIVDGEYVPCTPADFGSRYVFEKLDTSRANVDNTRMYYKLVDGVYTPCENADFGTKPLYVKVNTTLNSVDPDTNYYLLVGGKYVPCTPDHFAVNNVYDKVDTTKETISETQIYYKKHNGKYVECTEEDFAVHPIYEEEDKSVPYVQGKVVYKLVNGKYVECTEDDFEKVVDYALVDQNVVNYDHTKTYYKKNADGDWVVCNINDFIVTGDAFKPLDKTTTPRPVFTDKYYTKNDAGEYVLVDNTTLPVNAEDTAKKTMDMINSGAIQGTPVITYQLDGSVGAGYVELDKNTTPRPVFTDKYYTKNDAGEYVLVDNTTLPVNAEDTAKKTMDMINSGAIQGNYITTYEKDDAVRIDFVEVDKNVVTQPDKDTTYYTMNGNQYMQCTEEQLPVDMDATTALVMEKIQSGEITPNTKTIYEADTTVQIVTAEDDGTESLSGINPETQYYKKTGDEQYELITETLTVELFRNIGSVVYVQAVEVEVPAEAVYEYAVRNFLPDLTYYTSSVVGLEDGVEYYKKTGDEQYELITETITVNVLVAANQEVYRKKVDADYNVQLNPEDMVRDFVEGTTYHVEGLVGLVPDTDYYKKLNDTQYELIDEEITLEFFNSVNQELYLKLEDVDYNVQLNPEDMVRDFVEGVEYYVEDGTSTTEGFVDTTEYYVVTGEPTLKWKADNTYYEVVGTNKGWFDFAYYVDGGTKTTWKTDVNYYVENDTAPDWLPDTEYYVRTNTAKDWLPNMVYFMQIEVDKIHFKTGKTYYVHDGYVMRFKPELAYYTYEYLGKGFKPGLTYFIKSMIDNGSEFVVAKNLTDFDPNTTYYVKEVVKHFVMNGVIPEYYTKEVIDNGYDRTVFEPVEVTQFDDREFYTGEIDYDNTELSPEEIGALRVQKMSHINETVFTVQLTRALEMTKEIIDRRGVLNFARFIVYNGADIDRNAINGLYHMYLSVIYQMVYVIQNAEELPDSNITKSTLVELVNKVMKNTSVLGDTLPLYKHFTNNVLESFIGNDVKSAVSGRYVFKAPIVENDSVDIVEMTVRLTENIISLRNMFDKVDLTVTDTNTKLAMFAMAFNLFVQLFQTGAMYAQRNANVGITITELFKQYIPTYDVLVESEEVIKLVNEYSIT